MGSFALTPSPSDPATLRHLLGSTMRKSDLKKNHKNLDESIARYKSFLQKLSPLKAAIRLAQEKRDIVESALLRLCANWERFVDEHLVDCLSVDNSKLEDFLGVSIPAHPSKNLCSALIFGDGYRDFSSFGALKGFSKKPLPDDSNPFVQVTSAQFKRIDEVYKIRNYLAHYSGKSRRTLQRMYAEEYNMTRFIEPGQFLLAYNSRRLWAYFDAFESASDRMKSCY